MKYLFTTVLLIILSLTAFAQKTPSLKANQTISKKEVVAAQQSKITLNEHKCRLGHVAIQNNDGETFGLRIVFARPCSKENSVTINFNDLNDALLVKDLVLKSTGYDFFNLFVDKDGSSSFEIVYSR